MTWRAAIVAMAIVAAAFGCYERFADVNDVFCQSPDEMSEVMPGTRLPGLPLFNLSAPTRYNFFRSALYSQHGLGDVSFYYLAGAALSWLHLPISERTLYMAGGTANVAFAVAGGLFAAYVIGSATAGWIFALLVFVSPFYMFVSKSGWARLTWTPLLLAIAFLLEALAMRRRGLGWTVAFCGAVAFVGLTDGFMFLPVIVVIGWHLSGSLGRAFRDRVFVAGVASAALALAFDIVIGLIARRHGTGLTLISYVLLRGQTGLVPSLHVLAAWLRAIDYYLPFRGAWVVVLAAFAVAAAAGLRGDAVGAIAVWFALASIGLIRYAQALEAMDPASVPGMLNAFYLAPPSLLLVAWLLASIADARSRIAASLAPAARGVGVCAATAVLAVAMGRQAWAVAFAEPPGPGIGSNRLAKLTDMPLSACRTVKAAAWYIRSHEHGRLPYVFHLASDVYLGHIGEFYYGLSYTRSSAPEDPNHLLDFGWQQFGRHYPPEAFYKPYGVPHFDYYVEFTDERGHLAVDRAFAEQSGERLRREGARVVCTIRDGGKPIGRVLSFDGETPIDVDYRAAAAAWDRTFGRRDRLMQEPLAGSAYHFGYNWRRPDPASQ